MDREEKNGESEGERPKSRDCREEKGGCRGRVGERSKRDESYGCYTRGVGQLKPANLLLWASTGTQPIDISGKQIQNKAVFDLLSLHSR